MKEKVDQKKNKRGLAGWLIVGALVAVFVGYGYLKGAPKNGAKPRFEMADFAELPALLRVPPLFAAPGLGMCTLLLLRLPSGVRSWLCAFISVNLGVVVFIESVNLGVVVFFIETFRIYGGGRCAPVRGEQRISSLKS